MTNASSCPCSYLLRSIDAWDGSLISVASRHPDYHCGSGRLINQVP